MNNDSLPRLGVTLYSFTPAFHARQYSVEELIAKVAELRLGPGVEIVGFQSFRNFPHVSDEDASRFRELLARYDLEQSCLAVNADVGVRRDQLLTDDELVEYMTRQLRAAHKLGFPTVRMQNGAARVAERLVPVAEREDVRMGFEIHSPDTVHSSWVVQLHELADRLGSPYLGFIPDFGSTTTRLAPSALETYRRKGASEELLRALEEKWQTLADLPVDFDAGAQIGAFEQLAASLGGAGITDGVGVYAVGLFGHQNPKAWAEIAPHIVHVHGKFFGFDEHGDEPSVPYSELLSVLVESGYSGYISSEWEGWHWDDTPDPFAMVQNHHRLLESILNRKVAARASVAPQQ